MKKYQIIILALLAACTTACTATKSSANNATGAVINSVAGEIDHDLNG